MGRITRRPIRKKYERSKTTVGEFNKRVTDMVTPKTRINRKYDFLKYTRIVFKWATENYDIPRHHLELILFLYGEGLFTRYEYNEAHKIIGMKEAYTFKKFVDEGFITVFRQRANGGKKLFTLTDKAQKMCSRMHKILLGEEAIPETKRYNKIAQKDDTTSRFYMKAIAKMNKKRKEAQEED